MSQEPIQSEHNLSSEAQAEFDLVQTLLHLQTSPYPWNPANPEADSYLAQADQSLSLGDWPTDEIEVRATTLDHYLNQLWTRNALTNRFAVQVPSNLLETLSRQAQQLLAANLSLMDRLVQCAQAILPEWGEDDLQVLARPLAYAMRGNEEEAIETVLASVRSAVWSELSEIERARLALAMARYTLEELEK